jgi:hypothetical protein
VLLDAVGLLEHEALQVLEELALASEQLFHALWVAERQGPLAEQPVENGQHTRDLVRVCLDEGVHALLLASARSRWRVAARPGPHDAQPRGDAPAWSRLTGRAM